MQRFLALLILMIVAMITVRRTWHRVLGNSGQSTLGAPLWLQMLRVLTGVQTQGEVEPRATETANSSPQELVRCGNCGVFVPSESLEAATCTSCRRAS